MAVTLGEAVRQYALEYFQDSYNAELLKIDKERDDGIVLVPVESWFSFERAERKISKATMEVFTPPVTDAGSFPIWFRNVGAYTAGVKDTLAFDQILEVIVSHRPVLDGLDAAVGGNEANTRNRSDRYAAAVARLVRNDPRLGSTDSGARTIVAVPLGYTVAHSEGRNRYEMVRFQFRVSVAESATGEDTVGGGTVPVALQDQVLPA